MFVKWAGVSAIFIINAPIAKDPNIGTTRLALWVIFAHLCSTLFVAERWQTCIPAADYAAGIAGFPFASVLAYSSLVRQQLLVLDVYYIFKGKLLVSQAVS
jgi:hypothetical protein